MGCMTCIWCENCAPCNQLWWDCQNKQVITHCGESYIHKCCADMVHYYIPWGVLGTVYQVIDLYTKMLIHCGEPASRVSFQVVGGGGFINITLLQFFNNCETPSSQLTTIVFAFLHVHGKAIPWGKLTILQSMFKERVSFPEMDLCWKHDLISKFWCNEAASFWE